MTFLGGNHVYNFEFPLRNVPGIPFKEAVISCDNAFIVVLGTDKGQREAVYTFNSKTGELVSKVPLRYSVVKV